MGVQPSASRTELLLACPRPFDPETQADPDISGEPGRYGSAFHQVVAVCLGTSKKPLEKTARYAREVDRAAIAFDVKGAREELAGHVKSSVKVFRNWLAREKLKVAQVESAYAVAPKSNGAWTVRAIPPYDESHRYKIGRDELPGTIDLVATSANRRRVVVIDHKTGGGDTEEFARPILVPQMRTLGLAVTGKGVVGKVRSELGIFHADRRGLPALYAEPYEPRDQKAHAKALYRALRRIGTGFLRTGPQCERCKARDTCPAKAAELLGASTMTLVASANTLAVEPVDPKEILAPREDGLTAEDRAGALYDLLKRFRKLEKAASDEIKRLVRGGAVIETREGKVLAIQTQCSETLSKKSVLTALGKVAGERELKRLRAKGAIYETTSEKLISEK